MWRDRFRLEITASFTTSSEIGNEIIIRNLSPYPILITNWTIFFASRVWAFRKEEVCGKHYFDLDITVPSVSSYKIICNAENYFSTSHKKFKGKRIYFRVDIAGRGEITKKIYQE